MCSVNCYLMCVLSSIRHEIDVHGIAFNMCTASELDEFGYYNCEAGCGYVFSTKTAQNRYEYTFAISTFALINKPITITGFFACPYTNFPIYCFHFLDSLMK